MVDWDQVERLRSKGWDWDRIAGEPKVGFHAEEGAGEPGRALRALYYQRRSRAQRRPTKGEGAAEGGPNAETSGRRWTLARVGYLAVPLLGVWFVLAILFPSPVGTYVPAIPWLGFLLAVAGFVLAFGLLRTIPGERWSRAARTTLVAGLVLGAVVAGTLGLVGNLSGCPTLPAGTTSEPGGWQKVSTSAWKDGGLPVFFFYGSVACPYCSATSWAIQLALERFGTLSGTSWGHSATSDVYSNTPEVVLGGSSFSSQYFATEINEAMDDSHVTFPAAASCIQQAYISAYDSCSTCGIPFLVIGGVYWHQAALVDPGSMGSGNPNGPWTAISAQEVQNQIDNQSGPAWSSVSASAYLMEAFMVKLTGGQPTAVANDPNVAPLLKQIS